MNGARASARYCAWAISIEIYTWNRMEKIYHVKAFSNVARHYIVLAKMSVITQNITYPHCDGNLKLALPQLETNEVSFRKLWASANPFIIKKKIKAYALTFIGYWFILLCLVLNCLPRLKKIKHHNRLSSLSISRQKWHIGYTKRQLSSGDDIWTQTLSEYFLPRW